MEHDLTPMKQVVLKIVGGSRGSPNQRVSPEKLTVPNVEVDVFARGGLRENRAVVIRRADQVEIGEVESDLRKRRIARVIRIKQTMLCAVGIIPKDRLFLHADITVQGDALISPSLHINRRSRIELQPIS